MQFSKSQSPSVGSSLRARPCRRTVCFCARSHLRVSSSRVQKKMVHIHVEGIQECFCSPRRSPHLFLRSDLHAYIGISSRNHPFCNLANSSHPTAQPAPDNHPSPPTPPSAVVFIASQPWTSVATPALAIEARSSTSFSLSFPHVPQAQCVCAEVLPAWYSEDLEGPPISEDRMITRMSSSFQLVFYASIERRFRLLMRTRHGHLQEQKTLGSRLGSLY